MQAEMLHVDLGHRITMLAHHAQERLAVSFETGERPAMIASDPR